MGEKNDKKQTSRITNKAVRRIKQGFATVGTGAFVLGATAFALLGGNGKENDESWQEAFENFSNPPAHILVEEKTSSDVMSAITTAPATTEKVQTENGTVEVKTQDVVTTENQPAIFITVKDGGMSKEDKIAEYLQSVKESKASAAQSESNSQKLTAEDIKSQIKVTTTRSTKSEQPAAEQPAAERPAAEQPVKSEKPTGYILEEVKSSTQEVSTEQPKANEDTSLVDTAKENAKHNETKIDLSLSKNASIDDIAEVGVYSDAASAISVSKNEGLMLSFAAGPSIVVTGKGINFDLAMGLALSTNISEHAQFYTSIVAGTGVPLGKNATVGDLLSNGAVVASVGVKISWGGKNVKYTPDLLSVGSAIRHNVKGNGGNTSTPSTPDKPADSKGNISYDTGHYDNINNGSIGKDNGGSFPSNPFPDNDSFGFDFER